WQGFGISGRQPCQTAPRRPTVQAAGRISAACHITQTTPPHEASDSRSLTQRAMACLSRLRVPGMFYVAGLFSSSSLDPHRPDSQFGRDEESAVEVQEAIRRAKEYVLDVFRDEEPTNVGLEEVEFDDRDNVWNVTIG